MLTLLILVFFAVFAVSALLLAASRTGASNQTEQTMTVLHAALATGNRVAVDHIVDIRKEELLSAEGVPDMSVSPTLPYLVRQPRAAARPVRTI